MTLRINPMINQERREQSSLQTETGHIPFQTVCLIVITADTLIGRRCLTSLMFVGVQINDAVDTNTNCNNLMRTANVYFFHTIQV